MPESNEIQAPLERVVELFHRHGVRYVVIGGMAEVLQGGLRPTFDVDLCYDRSHDNLVALADALKEIHATLRGAPEGVPFILDARTLDMGSNFTFDTDLGPLDLLGWVEPIGDYHLIAAESRELPFGEGVITVLSIEALIRIKEHLMRNKDLASLDELRAIRDERKREDPRQP